MQVHSPMCMHVETKGLDHAYALWRVYDIVKSVIYESVAQGGYGTSVSCIGRVGSSNKMKSRRRQLPSTGFFPLVYL